MLKMVTILDAARQHFHHVAHSPHRTRSARELALQLEREAADELALWSSLSDEELLRKLAA